MSLTPSEKNKVMKELKDLRSSLEQANDRQDAVIKIMNAKIDSLQKQIAKLQKPVEQTKK